MIGAGLNMASGSEEGLFPHPGQNARFCRLSNAGLEKCFVKAEIYYGLCVYVRKDIHGAVVCDKQATPSLRDHRP